MVHRLTLHHVERDALRERWGFEGKSGTWGMCGGVRDVGKGRYREAYTEVG